MIGCDKMDFDSDVKKLEYVLTDAYSRFSRSWDAAPSGEKKKTMEYALAAQRIVSRLPDIITEDDAKLLLQQPDPLDVLSKHWVQMMGLEVISDDELTRCLDRFRTFMSLDQQKSKRVEPTLEQQRL